MAFDVGVLTSQNLPNLSINSLFPDGSRINSDNNPCSSQAIPAIASLRLSNVHFPLFEPFI